MKKKPIKQQKAHFRDAVREFFQKRSGESFDKIDSFQRSQWMTRFYTGEMLRVLSPGLVPDDEHDLEDCLTDGPSDACVDFIYRADGHVLIIQAKYRKQGADEDESQFGHFCDVLTRLHPESGSTYKINERVRLLASDIDWENDSFDLQFITLGKPTANMRAREQAAVINHPLVDLQDRVDISLLDEAQLNEKLREALSANQLISEPISLLMTPGEDGIPWISYKNADGREAYAGMIKAKQLRQLWQSYRYKLFALNIRNYVGDTSTNKGIINTALTEPENFFYFNNGISAVATTIEPDIKQAVLKCSNFSIVNGAQTARSLVKAHLKSPAAAGNATVLLRISQVSPKPDTSELTFIEHVTRFNNTQNSIKIADFRSNDDVQRALVREFASIGRGGKIYKYKNKRDAERNPRAIPINMEEFAKTVHAFRYGPIDFYGGTSYLFDLKRGYPKVFGDGTNVWEMLTMDQFRLLAGTWFLCEFIRSEIDEAKKELEEALSSDSELTDAELSARLSAIKGALERRWMLFFAVGELLRAKYRREKKDLDEDIRRLWKPSWFDNKDKNPAGAIVKTVRAASEMLVKIYKGASEQSIFVHRNWFRSEETKKRIQDEVRYSTSIVDTLASLTATQSGHGSRDSKYRA
jgi:hypothetical protein